MASKSSSAPQVSCAIIKHTTPCGLATGASWLCYYHALKLGPASGVAPIDKMSVVLVAIFGVTLLGESLSLAGWLGVALMTAGAILVALKG